MNPTINNIVIATTHRSLLFFIFCCLFALPPLCAQGSKTSLPSKAAGAWEFKHAYHTNDVEGISRNEIARLLHSKIVLTPQLLIACGQKVNISTVQIRQLTPEKLLADMHVSFEDLHIAASSIEEVVLNGEEDGRCLGAFGLPGEHIYIKSGKELIVEFEGVFFLAVRRPDSPGL